jgi:hypothetical protein
LGQGLFWCQVDIIDAANFLANGLFDAGVYNAPAGVACPLLAASSAAN